ncbi:F-box protein CPR1-like isoform X2 [Spinacia oleracea]|nr:F-box protein CPR1-like isoform X2 [Spinacia oleracea]
MIYNPTTQTYKKLPLLGISASIRNFGFGYDSIARDYKCVSVIQCGDGYRRGSFESEVMVYSLKDDSWRKARSPSVPFNFHLSFRGNVFVNDSIHWVGGINKCEAIVAFHLRDETFSTLPIPDSDSDSDSDPVNSRGGICVGILDGCLCLSVSNVNRDDVWVMREYGVAESWTKLFSIAKHNGHIVVERPVCYSINLKELFVHMSVICEVASINLDTMEISTVKGPDFNFCTKAYVCVENLLTL